MEKNKNRYKNFLVYIFAISLVIFTGIVFLRPYLRESFKLRGKIREEKEKLAKLNQKKDFLEGLEENELMGRFQLLLKVLPSKQDIIIPILTLRTLVSESNLQLLRNQVNPQGEKLKGGGQSMNFSLEVVGSKENIDMFLEKIKTTFPIMKVEKFNISLEEDSSWRASLEVKTFFLELAEDIGRVTDLLLPLSPSEEKIYREVSNFTSPISLSETGSPSSSFQNERENPFGL